MSLVQVFQIVLIILLNILSCFFWIWLYKELFKREVTIKEVILYGLISAIGSRGIIRSLGLQTILAKASIEEGMKISSSLTGKKTQEVSLPTDYISYALLCGIGFGVIENLIYIYYTLNDSLAAIGITRIITNTLLHSLFSGSIGYSIYLFMKNYSWKNIWIIGLGSALGIGFHVLYNWSLLQSYLAISIFFIIGGYYILAFLLYKSDRLFIDNQIIDNVNGKM